MKRCIPTLIIISSLLYLPAFAEQVRKLSWEDLVPAHLSTDGPFADLTQEQLDLVVWVSNFIDSLPPHGKDTEEFYREIGETIPQLKEAGIDINELMAKRKITQTSIVDDSAP